MAEKVKESIDIKATLQQVFEVATDFEAYPQWSTNVKGCEIRQRNDAGLGTELWMEVDAKIRVISYTIEYDYSNAPESFSWHLVEGDIKKLDGTYSFDEFDGVTEVTYELEIDPGFPIPGLLRRQAEHFIVRGALEDLKKRVESL